MLACKVPSEHAGSADTYGFRVGVGGHFTHGTFCCLLGREMLTNNPTRWLRICVARVGTGLGQYRWSRRRVGQRELRACLQHRTSRYLVCEADLLA